MKEKFYIFGIIILFCTIAMNGCVEQKSQLQLAIKTDKTSYNVGEVINITLTVINPFSHIFQLNMTGNSTYEIFIYNSSNQLVYGSNYWDVWGSFTIAANSEKIVVENYAWNQTSIIDNEPVSPGTYTIHAKIIYDDNKTSELEDDMSITIT